MLLATAVLVMEGRARADGVATTVTLHVVASPAEAREAREVLADLLSRIEIGIADEAMPKERSLVDVKIDLSIGREAPFVLLTSGRPPAVICRRSLTPQTSRQVLIESAAEVAYAAVETRARALGLLESGQGEPATAGTSDRSPPAGVTPAPEVVAGAADATSLRARAPNDSGAPGYGLDVSALAETQLHGFGAGLVAAGGGAGVTWSWRRPRIAPTLGVAVTYLRPVSRVDPLAFGPFNDLSIISSKLAATVDALAFRRVRLQVGSSLAFDVLQVAAPPATGGPYPAMMAGASGSSSALAIWAGATTRLSICVSQRVQIFVAAGADYQLRQPPGPPQAGGPGTPNGGYGAPSPASFEPSVWRSSFLTGMAFTLAGRPPSAD
jgi:hypothetical protein